MRTVLNPKGFLRLFRKSTAGLHSVTDFDITGLSVALIRIAGCNSACDMKVETNFQSIVVATAYCLVGLAQIVVRLAFKITLAVIYGNSNSSCCVHP